MTRYFELGGERIQITDDNKLVIDVADLEKISGVVPQFDDTDKLAVSLYGKDSAGGDTALLAGANGLRVTGLDNAGVVYAIGGYSQFEDNVTTGANHRLSGKHQVLFNGVTFDRVRSNEEVTLLASAARTATLQSADQVNYNGAGLIVIVDFETEVDTVSITPYLQIKDSISGNYFTIWTAAAAIEAVGTFAYLFAPGGAAGSFTEAVNLRLARTWRFGMTHADADSATYSVSAVVLV